MTFGPRTWNTGETVTAALLNTEIRDQLASMFDAWTAYTPVWGAATTAPNIGDGVLTGRYLKIGRRVELVIKQTMGATTTYGSGAYTWTIPFLSANQGVDYLGSSRLVGASAWHGQCVLSGNASVMSPVFPANASSTLSTTLTGTTPKTLLNGDVLRMHITYQSAA
ncbi:hypothetical protein ABZ371_00685 [Streptomyces sp. NPDC005899]|uniref:hypothetical protein n=1 Tax=Streptomyces sp. NPDC005899 TaxID=3155716 RepID=UPI0033DB1378